MTQIITVLNDKVTTERHSLLSLLTKTQNQLMNINKLITQAGYHNGDTYNDRGMQNCA